MSEQMPTSGEITRLRSERIATRTEIATRLMAALLANPTVTTTYNIEDGSLDGLVKTATEAARRLQVHVEESSMK